MRPFYSGYARREFIGWRKFARVLVSARTVLHEELQNFSKENNRLTRENEELRRENEQAIPEMRKQIGSFGKQLEQAYGASK